MYFINKLTDKKLILLGSFLGYLITATIIIVVIPEFQILKLAGILFFPFALSSCLTFWWYAPKIISAASLKKSIFYSIVAAIMTSFLTGALTGIAVVIEKAQKYVNLTQEGYDLNYPISNVIYVIVMYAVGGLIYSIPGIIIAGSILGKMTYQRKHLHGSLAEP